MFSVQIKNRIHRQQATLELNLNFNKLAGSQKRQIISDGSCSFNQILFQVIWLHDLDWDSQLPPNLITQWQIYRMDIIALNLTLQYIFSHGSKKKGCICLFICIATSAVRLELAPNLTCSFVY